MLNRYTIYKFIVKNNKLIQMKYQPISCSLYDRIESFSVLKKKVCVNYLSNDLNEESIHGVIDNLYSKDNSEFLVINGITIRLDKIKSISDNQELYG
jgi:transcriptional antiterminator Rof (Rho-off)